MMIRSTCCLLAFCSVTLLAVADELPAETLEPASVRFAEGGSHATPDFQMHVVPLLGRLGCNGRSCHGSFQGRGDLRLSLFGYDFQMDWDALTASASSSAGARIDRDHPAQSLILQKPSLQIDHEGGERFALNSWEHRLLREWIEAGAKGVTQPRELLRLEIEPAEVVFGPEPEPVSLRVVAVWQDQYREDVTPLCRFRTNDDSIVTVDQDGELTSIASGDTHVIAFYDNGVSAVPVLRPFDLPIGTQAETTKQAPGIDAFVSAKLSKLGLRPSLLCTDSEFLRRASLDLTGTLPAPAEVHAFLRDESSDKRFRKIEELLERPAYAAWWANKLCDYTGCNPNQQAELGQETSVQWYMWMYARLLENEPYDEIIRRIVLAKGRLVGQSYDEYAEEMSAYYRELDPGDFANRETMPHYWTRRSMQKPEDAAQAFAHNFLGIRLQCAQCHKHPFAPWTQSDFTEFSRFFENVQFGVQTEALPRYRELAQDVGLALRGDEGAAVRTDVLRVAQKGGVLPWRELYIRPRAEPASLSLLRSGSIALDESTDPREPIMQWMQLAENPWFARAIVNRVWAGYFHAGIIDPPDDLNPANPPSNPELLDWLTHGFIEQEYDLKWLHREIVASDTYQRSWRPSSNNRDDQHNFSRKIPRRMPAEVVYDSVKQALAANDQIEIVRTDLTRRAIGHLSMQLAGTYAMQVFGKPDRAVNCDCERDDEPTLLQSVFLQNDPLLEQRLGESGWLEEIAEQETSGLRLDTEPLVEQAWLRTLSRPPTQSESARAVQHLQAAESLVDGLRDLMWALINTKEFVLIQ